MLGKGLSAHMVYGSAVAASFAALASGDVAAAAWCR
jgi:hypothetical protein